MRWQNRILKSIEVYPGVPEYGISNIYAGVPVVIGSKGIEKIVELSLSKEEKANFDLSIKAVRELFEAAVKIDKNLAN